MSDARKEIWISEYDDSLVFDSEDDANTIAGKGVNTRYVRADLPPPQSTEVQIAADALRDVKTLHDQDGKQFAGQILQTIRAALTRSAIPKIEGLEEAIKLKMGDRNTARQYEDYVKKYSKDWLSPILQAARWYADNQPKGEGKDNE